MIKHYLEIIRSMTKKTSNERIQTDLDGLFDRIKGLIESKKKGGLSPGMQKVLDDGVEKLKKIYFDNFKINIRYSGFFLSDLYAKEDQSKILSKLTKNSKNCENFYIIENDTNKLLQTFRYLDKVLEPDIYKPKIETSKEFCGYIFIKGKINRCFLFVKNDSTHYLDDFFYVSFEMDRSKSYAINPKYTSGNISSIVPLLVTEREKGKTIGFTRTKNEISIKYVYNGYEYT